MTSMTGYAYREKNTETAAVSVEIKSVNSRFLDLTVNLPPYLNPLEQRFRERVSEKVVRGKVDVNIRVKNLKGCEHVSVDLEAAKSYAEALANISLATGLLLPDSVKAQTLLPLILRPLRRPIPLQIPLRFQVISRPYAQQFFVGIQFGCRLVAPHNKRTVKTRDIRPVHIGPERIANHDRLRARG